MKSIKQQYIDLREGNMTQANFMRNIRMSLPQYVTNVTSFDDSIRILKNKGILTEADMKISPETADKLKKAIDSITANNNEYHRDGYTMGFFEGEDMENKEEGKEISESISDADIIKKYNEMFIADSKTKFTDVAKALNIPEDQVASALQSAAMPKFGLREAKDEKGKWTNADGKSMYSQFKEIDNLNGQEVLIGIDYEMEKNENLTKPEAQKIVIKNLKKNQFYYTDSLISGVEGYEPEYMGGKSSNADARQMQPLEKNMGNVVDKKMGMKPVKDVEKVKKDADAKKETNIPEKNISLMSLIAKTVRGVKKMDATGEKMKKITVKEGMGEYSFTGHFIGDEAKELLKILPDAEVSTDEEPGQKYTTTVTSAKYNDKSVEHAVKQAKGEIKSAPSMSTGEVTAKFLTKERLKELIRKEMKEALGIGGGDNVTDVAGHQLDEVSSKVKLTAKHQAELSALSPEQSKKLYNDLADASTEVNDKDFSTRAEYAKAMKDAKIAVYKKYIKI
jgi:hypothetical protein